MYVINKLLISFLSLKINDYINFKENPLELLSWIFLSILLLIIYFFYKFYKHISKNRLKFLKNLSDKDTQLEQYQLYYLFFGVIIFALELFLEITKTRINSEFPCRVVVSSLLLSVYFLSTFYSFFQKNIRIILVIIFLFFNILKIYDFIYKPFEIIDLAESILSLAVSYNIFFNMKQYWIYMFTILVLLLISFFLLNVNPKLGIVLFYSWVFIASIHYTKHYGLVKSKDKSLFANEFVNKGSSLIIAKNTNGEILFCSDTIYSILGYKTREVFGLKLWELTDDKNYFDENLPKINLDNNGYNRKLKCKDGSYKYIKWIDQKYTDDVYISMGQDITSQIHVENRYQALVENAADIIYELDKYGNYSFMNRNSEKITGYTLEEMFKTNYVDIIRDDYKQKVVDFYLTPLKGAESFPTIIFPFINKQGGTVWVSQKASLKRDENGKNIGFTVIARDISELKKIEEKNILKENKSKEYNEIIKRIISNSNTRQQPLKDLLNYIIKKVATKLNCRVGYWSYHKDKIICESICVSSQLITQKIDPIYEKSYPNYFKTLKEEHQIVINDLLDSEFKDEFIGSDLSKLNFRSSIDTPLFINGEFKGVLGIKTIDNVREWDNEDINFVKSISDFITIAIETNQRIEIEKKLEYKDTLLTAATTITNSFLKSKDIKSIFNETLSILGNATKVDRAYYFENNEKEKYVSQKFEWVGENATTELKNPLLEKFLYKYFKDYIKKLNNNEQYNLLVNDITDEVYKKTLQDQNILSIIIIPIFVKNKFHSFIGLDDCTNERIWTEDEINILQTLANNISVAIERNENESMITESEERFRLLADNIPGTVYLSYNDDDFTPIYLNNEAKNLTGYDKEDFLSKKINFIDLINPEDKKTVAKIKYKALRERKKINIVYRITKKNGQVVWIEEYSDIILKNNEIAFIEGILIDVTKQKEAENAINEKEYAESANRAKSDFLTNMSHEIRTPLNAIIGFTDLLMDTKLEEFQKTYMSTINQSASLLMEIINDILDFSKIESGKLELLIEKCDLKEITSKVIDLASYSAQLKKLKLSLTISNNVPNNIWTDNIRLKQILINLVTNAIKFTNKGSISLNVSVKQKIKENEYILRFEVKDTGIGIKEEFQEKIFDSFSQGDSSTTRKFGGSGLGLTISNQLLSLMDSKLKLDSLYGVGSLFFFDLKVKTFQNEKVEKSEIKKQQIEIKNNNFESFSYNILIAEDNKVNMFLVKTLIKQILPKSIIHEAENGEVAVEKFKTTVPDIIFMDIQMPIKNGYDTCKVLRNLENGKKLPIIALTAGIEIGEKEKCLAAGMNDYASKPIIKERLIEILQKYLLNKN